LVIPERPGWRQQAESLGFIFHTMYEEPYWDETRAYVFTMAQIENDIEEPSTQLHAMCLAAVDVALSDEWWLDRLAIPTAHRDWIARSWKDKEPSLYGRFDLLYDGHGPAKLLEYNADTPTALYESGYYQWIWFEDQRQAGGLSAATDQYNAIQERLIERLGQMFAQDATVHFSSVAGSDEDRATVYYLQDCAAQAGLNTRYVPIEAIGIDHQHRFADAEGWVIDYLFKLYPYEDMLREDFGAALPRSPLRLVEPPWKSVLSNKGLLPLLWHLFPGHPNLLPAAFADDPNPPPMPTGTVRKPLFSREGENVRIDRPNAPPLETDGAYGAEGVIIQAYHPVPRFGEDYTVIGSWIIGDTAAGMGIREDRSLITRDLSRFVPHFVIA
jgi:glutathionylspermidine synthase